MRPALPRRMVISGYGSGGVTGLTVGPMQVLVCDDERDIRLLYRSAFERAGALVETADDGIEVMAAAERCHPQLIVLDIMMPNRDGLATLPELRERFPDTEVAIVTAYASSANFAKARDLGAIACFDKVDFLGRIPEMVRRFDAA